MNLIGRLHLAVSVGAQLPRQAGHGVAEADRVDEMLGREGIDQDRGDGLRAKGPGEQE